MGTKLEYCAINPLASSQNSNSYSFSVQYFVDDYFRTRSTVKDNCDQTIGSMDGFRSSSMDRWLDRHNMESIKHTMQMHEDIFKHQVRELHRLYSVQKMLMEEVKKEMNQNRFWTSSTTPMSSSGINQSKFISHVQAGDPSSRERSGSCSGETMKVASRGFDLERPAELDQDMSAEVSAIEEDQQASRALGGDDEEGEVELTLSIGGSSSKKTSTNNSNKPQHSQEMIATNSQSIFQKEMTSSASFKSERGEDCSGPNTPISSSSATFDQERKRPHWLFQGLSINRT